VGPRAKSFGVAVAVALAVTVAASAPPAVAGPGSAIDQYREQIPEGDGDKPTRDIDEGSESALPPAIERELASVGEAGEAAARLARRTSPEGSGTQRVSGGPSGEITGRDAERSPIASAAGQLGGGGEGGMGAVLPAILAAAALAAAALVAGRARIAAGGGAAGGEE